MDVLARFEQVAPAFTQATTRSPPLTSPLDSAQGDTLRAFRSPTG